MHYEVVYCNMDKKVAPGSSWKRLIRLYLPIVAVGSLWKFMENANDRFQELLSATCNFWLGLKHYLKLRWRLKSMPSRTPKKF